MKKLISMCSQSYMYMEHNGKVIKFSGDFVGYETFLVWINFAEWKLDDQTVPMTAGERLEIMRQAHKYLGNDDFRFSFFDDTTGIKYSNEIYFDPKGEPMVYIEGNTIKSNRTDVKCFCDIYEENSEFDGVELDRLRYDLSCCVRSKIMRKVHVWKKYGKYKEKWYQCKRCKKVWGLVDLKDSTKGLWRRIK